MSETNTQRKRRSPAEWEQLIWVCESSGLSQAAFCRQQGVNIGTLHYWKRRLRDQRPPASPSVIDLGELRPSDNPPITAPSGWVFELLLGHWLRLHLRRA